MLAEWRWLLGVTYAADEALLRRFLPPGCAVDTLEGSPRVSLVCFGFHDTRVGRFRVPGHVRFPEINLRFYVSLDGERGVCFVRELVPRPAIAWVARVLYNEPYRATRMVEDVTVDASEVTVRHEFAGGSRVLARASARGAVPHEGSAEYWLTHHHLGVGRSHRERLLRYHVAHELWALHEVSALDVSVDFEAVYGPEWAWLSSASPSHVTLAAGSPVAVYFPT